MNGNTTTVSSSTALEETLQQQSRILQLSSLSANVKRDVALVVLDAILRSSEGTTDQNASITQQQEQGLSLVIQHIGPGDSHMRRVLVKLLSRNIKNDLVVHILDLIPFCMPLSGHLDDDKEEGDLLTALRHVLGQNPSIIPAVLILLSRIQLSPAARRQAFRLALVALPHMQDDSALSSVLQHSSCMAEATQAWEALRESVPVTKDYMKIQRIQKALEEHKVLRQAYWDLLQTLLPNNDTLVLMDIVVLLHLYRSEDFKPKVQVVWDKLMQQGNFPFDLYLELPFHPELQPTLLECILWLLLAPLRLNSYGSHSGPQVTEFARQLCSSNKTLQDELLQSLLQLLDSLTALSRSSNQETCLESITTILQSLPPTVWGKYFHQLTQRLTKSGTDLSRRTCATLCSILVSLIPAGVVDAMELTMLVQKLLFGCSDNKVARGIILARYLYQHADQPCLEEWMERILLPSNRRTVTPEVGLEGLEFLKLTSSDYRFNTIKLVLANTGLVQTIHETSHKNVIAYQDDLLPNHNKRQFLLCLAVYLEFRGSVDRTGWRDQVEWIYELLDQYLELGRSSRKKWQPQAWLQARLQLPTTDASYGNVLEKTPSKQQDSLTLALLLGQHISLAILKHASQNYVQQPSEDLLALLQYQLLKIFDLQTKASSEEFPWFMSDSYLVFETILKPCFLGTHSADWTTTLRVHIMRHLATSRQDGARTDRQVLRYVTTDLLRLLHERGDCELISAYLNYTCYVVHDQLDTSKGKSDESIPTLKCIAESDSDDDVIPELFKQFLPRLATVTDACLALQIMEILALLAQFDQGRLIGEALDAAWRMLHTIYAETTSCSLNDSPLTFERTAKGFVSSSDSSGACRIVRESLVKCAISKRKEYAGHKLVQRSLLLIWSLAVHPSSPVGKETAILSSIVDEIKAYFHGPAKENTSPTKTGKRSGMKKSLPQQRLAVVLPEIPSLNGASIVVYAEMVLQMVVSTLAVVPPARVQYREEDGNPFGHTTELAIVFERVLALIEDNLAFFPRRSTELLVATCHQLLDLSVIKIKQCVEWRQAQPLLAYADRLAGKVDHASIQYLEELLQELTKICVGAVAGFCSRARQRRDKDDSAWSGFSRKLTALLLAAENTASTIKSIALAHNLVPVRDPFDRKDDRINRRSVTIQDVSTDGFHAAKTKSPNDTQKRRKRVALTLVAEVVKKPSISNEPQEEFEWDGSEEDTSGKSDSEYGFGVSGDWGAVDDETDKSSTTGSLELELSCGMVNSVAVARQF